IRLTGSFQTIVTHGSSGRTSCEGRSTVIGAVLPTFTSLPYLSRSLRLVTMTMSTALLTDHYELTMLQAALRSGAARPRAAFEVCPRPLPRGRRHGVATGTGRVLEPLEHFRSGEQEPTSLQERNVVHAATLAFLADCPFSRDIHAYPE